MTILLIVSLLGCHQEETKNTLTADVESGIMNTTDESKIIKNTEEPYIIKTYEETPWELMPEYTNCNLRSSLYLDCYVPYDIDAIIVGFY